VKSIFFNLLNVDALKLIAKKVAKGNGDIRIAFDLMKSTLSKLLLKIQSEGLPKDEEITIDIDSVLTVF
jgi:hypothetical protein